MPGVPAVLLTGTIGSGKTVVAVEVGALLQERGVSAALVDLDWLGWAHLGSGFDGYDGLIARNLAAVWPNFVAAGAHAFVLVRAVREQASIERIRRAVPDAELTVVRLTAPQALIERRIRRRDAGVELVEHIAASADFARALDEAGLDAAVVVNDERPIREVAGDVLRAWSPKTY
jgi:adenylylsulfate kinase